MDEAVEGKQEAQSNGISEEATAVETEIVETVILKSPAPAREEENTIIPAGRTPNTITNIQPSRATGDETKIIPDSSLPELLGYDYEFGYANSGGGIRSCSIGSGVLCYMLLHPRQPASPAGPGAPASPQNPAADAKRKKKVELPANTLPKFMSSVSGGGYLLCSYMDWLRKKARAAESPADYNPQTWFPHYLNRMQHYASYYIPALDGANLDGELDSCYLWKSINFLLGLALHLIFWVGLLVLVLLGTLPMAYPFALIVDYWVGPALRQQDRSAWLGPVSLLAAFVLFVLLAAFCEKLSKHYYDATKNSEFEQHSAQSVFSWVRQRLTELLKSALGYMLLFCLFMMGGLLVFLGLSCFVQEPEHWSCAPRMGLPGWLLGWGLLSLSLPWLCAIGSGVFEPPLHHSESVFPSDIYFTKKLTKIDKGPEHAHRTHAYFSSVLTNFFYKDVVHELERDETDRLVELIVDALQKQEAGRAGDEALVMGRQAKLADQPRRSLMQQAIAAQRRQRAFNFKRKRKRRHKALNQSLSTVSEEGHTSSAVPSLQPSSSTWGLDRSGVAHDISESGKEVTAQEEQQFINRGGWWCCTGDKQRARWQTLKMVSDVSKFLARITGLFFVCGLFCEIFFLASTYAEEAGVSPWVANILIMGLVLGVVSQFGSMFQSVGLLLSAAIFTNFIYWRVFQTSTLLTPPYTEENWERFMLVCVVALLFLPLTAHLKSGYVHHYYRYRLTLSFFLHKNGRYNVWTHLRYLMKEEAQDINQMQYMGTEKEKEKPYTLSMSKKEPFAEGKLPILNVCATLNGWLQTDEAGQAIYGSQQLNAKDTTDQLVLSSEGVVLRFVEGVGVPIEVPCVEGKYLRHPRVALSTAMTMAAAAMSINMGAMDNAAPTKMVRDFMVLLGLNMGKNMDTVDGDTENPLLKMSHSQQLLVSILMNALTFFWPFLVLYLHAPEWLSLFCFLFFIGIPCIHLVLSQIITPGPSVLLVLSCLETIPAVLFAVTYSNLERWGKSPGKKLFISDGAFSENMGVLGLAARRVKYIMATMGAGVDNDIPRLVHQLRTKLFIQVEVLRSDRERRQDWYKRHPDEYIRNQNPYLYVSRFEADTYFQRAEFGGVKIDDFALGDFPERVDAVMVDFMQFARDFHNRVMVLRMTYPKLERSVRNAYEAFCGELPEVKQQQLHRRRTQGMSFEKRRALEEVEEEPEEDRVGYLFIMTAQGDFPYDKKVAVDRRASCRGHVRPGYVHEGQVGGCCLGGCSGDGLAKLCCFQKGKFPEHPTWNQYLSSEHFSAYHLEGLAMAEEAYSLRLEDNGETCYGAFLRATDRRNPFRSDKQMKKQVGLLADADDCSDDGEEKGPVFTCLFFTPIPTEHDVHSLAERLKELQELLAPTNGLGWEAARVEDKHNNNHPDNHHNGSNINDNNNKKKKHNAHGHFLAYYKVGATATDWDCHNKSCPRVNIRNKLVKDDMKHQHVTSLGGVPMFKCYSVTRRRAEEEDKEREKQRAERAVPLPRVLKHLTHQHQLVLRSRGTEAGKHYVCTVCREKGDGYCYKCEDCMDFTGHLRCVRPAKRSDIGQESTVTQATVKPQEHNPAAAADELDEELLARIAAVVKDFPPPFRYDDKTQECDRILCDLCVISAVKTYSTQATHNKVYESQSHPHLLCEVKTATETTCQVCGVAVGPGGAALQCLGCSDYTIHAACNTPWSREFQESLEPLRYIPDQPFAHNMPQGSKPRLPAQQQQQPQPTRDGKTAPTSTQRSSQGALSQGGRLSLAGVPRISSTGWEDDALEENFFLLKIAVRSDRVLGEKNQNQGIIDRVVFHFSDGSRVTFGGTVSETAQDEPAFILDPVKQQRLVKVLVKRDKEKTVRSIKFLTNDKQHQSQWYGAGGEEEVEYKCRSTIDSANDEDLPAIGDMKVKLSREGFVTRLETVVPIEDRSTSSEQFQAHERLVCVSQARRHDMYEKGDLILMDMGKNSDKYFEEKQLTYLSNRGKSHSGGKEIFADYFEMRHRTTFIFVFSKVTIIALLILWIAGIMAAIDEHDKVTPDSASKFFLMLIALFGRFLFNNLRDKLWDNNRFQNIQGVFLLLFVIFRFLVLIYAFCDFNDLIFPAYPNNALLLWGTVTLALRAGTDIISSFGWTLYYYRKEIVPRYFHRVDLRRRHKEAAAGNKAKEEKKKKKEKNKDAASDKTPGEGETSPLGAGLDLASEQEEQLEDEKQEEEEEEEQEQEQEEVTTQEKNGVFGSAEEQERFPLGTHTGMLAQVCCLVSGVALLVLSGLFAVKTGRPGNIPDVVLLVAAGLYMGFTLAVVFVMFEASMLQNQDTPDHHLRWNLYGRSSADSGRSSTWNSKSCGFVVFMWVCISFAAGLYFSSSAIWIMLGLPVGLLLLLCCFSAGCICCFGF